MTSEHHAEELKRITLIQKTTAVADIMNIRQIEEKLGQYCESSQLYAEASCELTRRSKLSQEEAAKACKVYKPYIRDVLQQIDAIFVMEKELRGLKGRGHFPIPTITPHGARVETPNHINKFLEAVDQEMAHIITTVRECERNYEKEKEEARIRDQETKTSRAIHRPEVNFPTINSSNQIKNTGMTGNQNQHTERSIHFNPNPIHHLYSMIETTSHNGQYEPPANGSIIQGAGTAPGGQFKTNVASTTCRNEAWRNNNGGNTPTHNLPTRHDQTSRS